MAEGTKSLSPAVAAMSPNLYKTALGIGMSSADAKLIDQMGRSWQLGKDLLAKSEEKARKEFLALDPTVQANIRNIYSTESRFRAEQSLFGKVVGAVAKPIGAAIATAVSPVTAAFKAADTYGKVLHTGYTAYKQVSQDKPFSKKVLSDAYNGYNSWKWDEVKQYEDKYGKALTTLARGVAEKRTIGQSIDLYGKFDDAIGEAIQYAGDNPDKFQALVDRLAQDAQVSPGRDLSPSVSKLMQIDDNSIGYKMWKVVGVDLKTEKSARAMKKALSTFGDGIYNILGDPMTYTGVGVAAKAAVKGVGGHGISFAEAYARFGGFKTKGQKLAAKYQFIADRGGVEEGMAWAFNEPVIKKLWDDQLGPRIKKFADAEGAYEKGQVLESMKFDFPEWYNTETIKTFAKHGVYDAKSAQEFFTKVDDTNMFLQGTVDGISYRRNGIPFARRTRVLTSAVHKAAYSVFNPTAAGKTGETLAKAEADNLTLIETLSRIADDDALVNTKILDELELEKDVTKARQILYKMGVSAKRTPGQIIWGEDSVKTADAIRSTAASVLPNDMANALTIWLIDQPENVQLTVVRNLQYGFMKRLGIADEDAFNILNKTYGDTFHAAPDTPAPEGWEDVLPDSIYTLQNNIPYLIDRGALHASQLKKGIAPLPYDELYRLSTREDVRNIGETLQGKEKYFPARAVSRLFSGASHSATSMRLGNIWTAGTLFPRLGIRTNVDEGLMYSLVNESADVFNLGASKFEKDLVATTAISGTTTTIGPAKGGFYWLAKKFNIKRKDGRSLDPREVIPVAEREEIKLQVQAALKEKYDVDVPMAEISDLELRDAVIARAEEIYSGSLGTESWNNMKKVMRHNPNFGAALANSSSAKGAIAGRIVPDFYEASMGLDSFSLFMKEHGLETGGEWSARDIKKLNELETGVAMWRLFNIRFGHNNFKIVEGRYFSAVTAFFQHNALKTKEDFELARKAILKQMEVYWDDSLGTWVSEKPAITEAALNPFGQVVKRRQEGISDAEIANELVSGMLMDMRFTFHGSTTGFNQKLLNLIKAKEKQIVKTESAMEKDYRGSWSKAVASLEWKEFDEATVGMRPVTDAINSDITLNGKSVDLDGLKEDATFAEQFDKRLGVVFELMSHQVDGFFRMPALKVGINKAFKQLKPYESMLVKRHRDAMLEENPFADPEKVLQRAQLLAEKQVTELAVKQASDAMLEFVDNPNIRSNFAISIKHMGRFVRATEDFQRRMYRMYTKAPLRMLYRMRLLHTGLDASGSVFTDENGDDYLIFPSDAIINNAVNSTLAVLTQNESLKLPVGTQFALKTRLMNPSFAPDAGAPAFAGPQSGMAVLTAKAFLRELPFVPFRDKFSPYTNWAADKLDMFAMGHVGKNTTFGDAMKVMFPMLATGVIGTVQPQESSRVKTSTVMQAIGFHQAFGYSPSVNATTQEKKDYLRALKISSTSIIGSQFILGNFNPAYPTLKDSAGLPDFIKQTGISSFKSEFWDIYNGIIRNAGPDVTDPFGLALATFTGQNPKKLAYLVPRNTKEMKVVINRTNNLKNWVNSNRPFVDTYGEIAYIFAPKVGEYNPDIYSFLEAEEIIKEKGLLDYLDAVQTAADKEDFFSMIDQEKKDLSNIADYSARKAIMAAAERDRQLLMYSNPSLEEAINNPDNRGTLKKQLNALSDAVREPKSPMNKDLRAAMNLSISKIRAFIEFNENPYIKNSYDFDAQKVTSKEEIVNFLYDLSKSSLEIREANRLIFTPILNSYARNAVSASPER